MTGNAIAFACTVLAVVVLGIATWKARGVPDGGSEARVVSDQTAASSDISPGAPTSSRH